jgi:hypothetical protein
LNAVALTVMLGSLVAAQVPDNLDFGTGTLAGWWGHGFYVTTADHRGPSTRFGVCSSDRGKPGRTGTLRYTFVVPPGAAVLRCRAYAARPGRLRPDDRLDVLLLTDRSDVVPKKVKGPGGWEPADVLLPPRDGRAREYCWDVSNLAGRRVQVLLVDEDARRGCHLFCSGFRLAGTEDTQERDFAEQMQRLVRDKGLAPVTRFESKHFVAWSNAEADFTRTRLRDCEMIYQLFFEHFRRRGFAVRAPAAKLMVAVFDSQAGFEAYLGLRLSLTVTGVYSRDRNQLAVYDLSQNEGLVTDRNKALQATRNIRRDEDKRRYLETVHRHLGEWSQDGSLSTSMHETAHHLSFNCGLLSRHGDVPAWLSEGLATYCEATEQGRWQGIGEPNPHRAAVLATVVQRGWKFIPLRVLVQHDEWRFDRGAAVVGYSQAWGLFHFLMQRPAAFRSYLALISPRRTPDHRLTDFGQAFGPDLDAFERRYFDYLRVLAGQAPAGR